MRVTLQPPAWATHLLSDLTDWQRQPLPVSEVEPFTLPDDVYFEYAYLDAAGERRPDPDNQRPPSNPWWTYARAIVGPRYRPDSLAFAEPRAPRGTLQRLDFSSQVLRQKRRVLIYSPAGHENVALPHVVFQDGKAYYGWGRVPQVFDRLLDAAAVGAAHLVFVPPVARTSEYGFNADYARFITDELLPFADAHAPCDGFRVGWGASLGGLFSAWLAWQRPDLWQTVVAQSGAFLYGPGQDLSDPFAGSEWFRTQIAAVESRPLRWYLDCGRLEWLFGCNRRLAAELSSLGHDVAFTSRNAGHNWVNWRNGLSSAFKFTLGAGSGNIST